MKIYETVEIAEIRREDYININEITDKIIGCAIKVHKKIGPGLFESVYQAALAFELNQTQLTQRSLRLKTMMKLFPGKFKNFDITLNNVKVEYEKNTCNWSNRANWNRVNLFA